MGNVAGKSPLRWPAWLSPKNNRLRLPGTFAAGLLVLYFLPVELKVGGEVEVAPARNTDVRAQVEGIIDDVFVKERDRVAAGDTLARLADHDYRSRLEMADAELAEKRANLRLLEAGARPEERDVARSAVGRAEERLRFAQAELERTRRLVAIEASPKSDLERAEGRGRRCRGRTWRASRPGSRCSSPGPAPRRSRPCARTSRTRRRSSASSPSSSRASGSRRRTAASSPPPSPASGSART
jgi:HlyD family secretion protein